jgi:hypothetical protein
MFMYPEDGSSCDISVKTYKTTWLIIFIIILSFLFLLILGVKWELLLQSANVPIIPALDDRQEKEECMKW